MAAVRKKGVRTVDTRKLLESLKHDTSPDTEGKLRLTAGAEKKVTVSGGTERALVVDAVEKSSEHTDS